jgi:hypothetical protein
MEMTTKLSVSMKMTAELFVKTVRTTKTEVINQNF